MVRRSGSRTPPLPGSSTSLKALGRAAEVQSPHPAPAGEVASRYGYMNQPMEILDYAKKGYHGGHYTCVNLQNSDTVEFRMFRGTLKINTLLATLKPVDRICDVTINLSDEELRSLGLPLSPALPKTAARNWFGI